MRSSSSFRDCHRLTADRLKSRVDLALFICDLSVQWIVDVVIPFVITVQNDAVQIFEHIVGLTCAIDLPGHACVAAWHHPERCPQNDRNTVVDILRTKTFQRFSGMNGTAVGCIDQAVYGFSDRGREAVITGGQPRISDEEIGRVFCIASISCKAR